MSQSGSLNGGGSGGGGVTTLIGDMGTQVTGNVLVTALDQGNSSTSTVSGGTTLEVNFTDSTANIVLGANSGARTITTASGNCGVGVGILQALTSGGGNVVAGNSSARFITTGSNNTIIGTSAGNISTGSNNTLIGINAGSNLIGSESNNVYIRSTGVTSESNTIRIGNTQTKAYMQGINGNTVSNAVPVVIDSTTGQLGTTNAASSFIGFSAYVSAAVSNVTGDGTAYTIIADTELFDVGNNYDPTTGVFTSPQTGIYLIPIFVTLMGITVDQTNAFLNIVTSYGDTYQIFAAINPFASQSGGYLTLQGSCMVPLTAGDTFTVTLTVLGTTAVVGVYGSGTPFFQTVIGGTLMR